MCTPVPQKTSSEEVQDTRDIIDDTDNKKEVKKNKDKEEDSDVGEAVIDILGGVLNLVNGALDAAEEIAGNEVNWYPIFTISFRYFYLINCISDNFTSLLLLHFDIVGRMYKNLYQIS